MCAIRQTVWFALRRPNHSRPTVAERARRPIPLRRPFRVGAGKRLREATTGIVTPRASIGIGALAGIICYRAGNLKTTVGYDDSLDVVGGHGVGGTWGALPTGIFATKSVNEAGADGLLYGNPKQLLYQLIAVLVTIVLGFVMTTIILKVLDGLMGLRVSDEDEQAGLDLSQHSETAYALGGGTEYSQTGGSGGAFAEAMRASEAKARSH